MNFDDPQLIAKLDHEDMLGQIAVLPQQLEAAYRLGLELPLPLTPPIKAVILCGMGGPGMGGDLLSAFASPTCPVPLIVHHDYDLPAWAEGREVLVIASSHSGNTEETLSSIDTAVLRGCQVLAFGTGGKLMAHAQQAGTPFWQFSHSGQPRSAVGWTFGLQAAALVRLGLLTDMASEISTAASEMRAQMVNLMPDQPVSKNRAKRDAGQLMGRWVVVFGSDHLAPVARRWKDQFNELAKTWAQAETLPEADHNTLAGTLNPEASLSNTMVLFLEGEGCHPRNQARARLTRHAFLQMGIGTDSIKARGATRLAQMWTSLHYGDFLAFYLALNYGMDPGAVEMIAEFKTALGEM